MSTPQTLVLQAPTLDQARLTELAALSGASDSRSVAANVVRLDGVDPARRELVLARAERLSVDANYVDSARRFADFGLLVSDMDSTLITIECIDEIADMQGLKPQVAAITERSMRGELDFTESLKARVALLAGLPEAALARVYDERLQLMAGARELLAALPEWTAEAVGVALHDAAAALDARTPYTPTWAKLWPWLGGLFSLVILLAAPAPR